MIVMNTIVGGDNDIASRHVLGVILNQLRLKPHSTFLLSTGSTPLRLYQLMGEAVRMKKASFSKAMSFNLDEYLGLGRNRPQSYNSFMWNNLFSKIDILQKNVSIPLSRPKNAKNYCKEYEKKINNSVIDLAIIGIGENGHIGFNEPGTPFSSVTHVADLSKSTIKANSRFFRSPEMVPKKAITVGLNTIMNAKKIILLAFGAKKARAVKLALEGKISEKVPASILQKHNDVTFVLDKNAASLIKHAQIEPPTIGGVKMYSEINLPRGKRIMFFSPHPDDAPISSGALLSALSGNNSVYEVIMTTGHKAVINGKNKNQRIRIREAETKEESKILGTKAVFLKSDFYDNENGISKNDSKRIRNLIDKIKPDIILVPQKTDPHPTHILSRMSVLEILPRGIDIWEYETAWGQFSHNEFNAFFEFSQNLMNKKLRAIKKHKSQLERTRFDIAAKNMGEMRGIIITEQILDYGDTPLKTKKYLELYDIKKN